MIHSFFKVAWRFCCGVWRSRGWTCCWRSFLENLHCTTSLGSKKTQRISYCTIRKINWALGEEQSTCKLQPAAEHLNLLNMLMVFLLKHHPRWPYIKNWLPLLKPRPHLNSDIPIRLFWCISKVQLTSKRIISEPKLEMTIDRMLFLTITEALKEF